MKKIGIGIDYSNICKGYNTAYLDRDNKDPATAKCMQQVVAWLNGLLSEFLETFGYNIYHLSSDAPVKVEEVASNRFLFYSLEKDITLQSYVMQKSYIPYDNSSAWVEESHEGVLIQNDEDGEGIYLYCNENSEEYRWMTQQLEAFSLDEVAAPRK